MEERFAVKQFSLLANNIFDFLKQAYSI